MKRTSSSSDERPAKVARISGQEYFEEAKEIQLSDIDPSTPTDAFFKGKVTMKRPTDPISGITSFQLTSKEYPHDYTVNIDLNFSYSSFDSSYLTPGDYLLVSLDNASFVPCTRKTFANHLAWDILFPGNWTLQLVKSFGRKELSGTVIRGLQEDTNDQNTEQQTERQHEIMDFLATNPETNESTNSAGEETGPSSPFRSVTLPSCCNSPPPGIILDKNSNPEDNDKLFVHHLGTDPWDRSYAYNPSEGPPRNAYAALAKAAETTGTSETQLCTVYQSSPNRTREHGSSAQSPKHVGLPSLPERKNWPSVGEVTSGGKGWMSRAKKVIKQIGFDEATSEYTWKEQTYSWLLSAEGRRTNMPTEKRRKNYEFALAYIAKLEQAVPRNNLTKESSRIGKGATLPVAPKETSKPMVNPDLLSLEAGFVSPRAHFRALNGLGLGERVSVAGVVTDVSPPKRTRGDSWVSSVKLIDPSNTPGSPFRITLFCSSQELAPSVKPGQGFLVKGLMIGVFQSSLTGTGFDDSFSWIGYDFEQKRPFFSTSSPQNADLVFPIGPEEVQYLDKLAIWYRAVPKRDASDQNKKMKKVKTISEAIVDEFFITHLEVLKIHPNPMVVYATDYTPAPKLLDIPYKLEELEKLRPCLIHIALFDEDKEMGHLMKVGEVYTFSNLRLANGPRGLFFKSGVRGYGCKIDLSHDNEAKAVIQQRKQQFYGDLEKKKESAHADTIDESATLHLGTDSVQANETRVDVKLDSAEEIGQAVDDPGVPIPSPTTERDPGDTMPEQKAADSVILSPVITCLHPDQPVTSIAAVKKNGEFPNKFRLKARMVDMVPRNPAKMIKRYCDMHRRQLEENERRCLDCADMMTEPKYSYYMRLMLQDEFGERLQVGLGSEEANLFFGIDAEEAFNSVSLREKVIEMTRPWLGNFWKGQKEKFRAWYRPDEYLDLAVQTWQIEQDGMPRAVYTVCGTRLERSSGEDGAGAKDGLPVSPSVKRARAASNAASSSLHRSTMLLPSTLVFLLATCLAASAYTKLDWDKYDHFVIQHDPAGGASLHDCCRALDVELVEQVGQLDDHWLVRSQKHLAKRAESHPVIDTFNTVRLHAREALDKRIPSSASAKDVVNSIKMLERQELRKRVKRELAPPSNSLQRRQQGLGGGAITSYAKKFDIKDPIFPTQWHYVNDQYPQHVMNVTGLWEMGVTGKGVISAMVDDGLDYESDDLAQNFDASGSYDFNDHVALPKPILWDDHHGTRCAGEIAAVKNDACGIGIAYESKVAGIRILSGPISDVDEAAALNYGFQNTSIYSCSWGPPDDGRSMAGPSLLIQKAVLNGINKGRAGKGSVFVFAAGNGAASGDQCNFDGYTNSIYSVTVAAVDYKGLHPYYSEACAANMITTYSSGSGEHVHTTDVGKNKCSSSHGGTSAAAPQAVGVFALALSVRPDLTWRDVQHLCVKTAGMINSEDPDWEMTSINKKYSYKYGWGVLDAYSYVQAARDWKLVNPQAWAFTPVIELTGAQMNATSGEMSGGEPITATGVTSKQIITKDFLQENNFERIEHIDIKVWITHAKRGDVEVELTSPTGVKSILAGKRVNDVDKKGFPGWRFMTVKHWGESGIGTWTIKVNDQGNPDLTGKFLGWSLQFWGESMDPTKAKLYDLPAATMSLPEPPHPSSTSMPSASKTKVLTKPTNHLPDDHGTAEGEAHKPSFPQDDAATPSSSTNAATGEGYFSHITDLLKSSTWLIGALALTLLFAGGIIFYFWRRRIRRRSSGNYAVVPGDSLGMSALERGGSSRGGARSKELYDAFGEVSDDEANEGVALVGNRPEGFHSGFLRDDEEEDAQKPYRDHPEDSADRPKQTSGHLSPQHNGSEGESSVSGSWVDTEHAH